MFINRIRSQIRQIQTYAEQIKKQRHFTESSSSSSTGGSNSDTSNGGERNGQPVQLARDQFNIVKVILVYTKGRRLYALHSQSKFFFLIHDCNTVAFQIPLSYYYCYKIQEVTKVISENAPILKKLSSIAEAQIR